MTTTKATNPRTRGTHVDQLISSWRARSVITKFLTGWSVRRLGLYYGLSCGGVEDLLRLYGRIGQRA